MLFFTLTLLASVAGLVNAQAALPNVQSFPAACSSGCSAVIEVGVLCVSEYQNSTDIAACFCNGGLTASDLSSCSSCLTTNGDSSLASSLSSAAQTCQEALQTCAFSCDFPTCASSDIACQCSATYLQNIFDCASCNSANNNTNATLLSNYNDLKDSCVNQNYTQTPSATLPLPSPTGESTYTAPSLTATGSGGAAVVSATGNATVPASASATSKVGSVTGSASGSASSGAASAASTSKSAAMIGAKADFFGLGVVAVSIGAVVAGAATLF